MSPEKLMRTSSLTTATSEDSLDGGSTRNSTRRRGFFIGWFRRGYDDFHRRILETQVIGQRIILVTCTRCTEDLPTNKQTDQTGSLSSKASFPMSIKNILLQKVMALACLPSLYLQLRTPAATRSFDFDREEYLQINDIQDVQLFYESISQTKCLAEG